MFRFATGAALACMGILAGCSQDDRVTYAAPPVEMKQAVTLRGENAVFVDGVDGQRVEGLQTYTNPPFSHIQGGNEVRVGPGKHTIAVNMYVGRSTMGSTLALGMVDPQTETVDLDLIPGHTYLLTTNIKAVRRHVVVKDLTAEAAGTPATADVSK
jgi:hypothetical protein